MKKEIIIPLIVSIASAVMFFVIFGIDTETEINPTGISVNTGTVNTGVTTGTVNTGVTTPTAPVVQQQVVYSEPCDGYSENYMITLEGQPLLDGTYEQNVSLMKQYSSLYKRKLSHDIYSMNLRATEIQPGDKIAIHIGSEIYTIPVAKNDIKSEYGVNWVMVTLKELTYFDSRKQARYGDISQAFKKGKNISIFLINDRGAMISNAYLYYNDNCSK